MPVSEGSSRGGGTSVAPAAAAKEIAARSAAEQWTDAEGWEKQGPIVAPVRKSADMQEGLRAFVERRKPDW